MRFRHILDRVANAALAVTAVLAFYGAAGMIGGAIPSNAEWREPAHGVTIWVESNGVHTGIVVPKVAAGVDWRPMLRADHLRDPRYAGYGYAGFGWGEANFYLDDADVVGRAPGNGRGGGRRQRSDARACRPRAATGRGGATDRVAPAGISAAGGVSPREFRARWRASARLLDKRRLLRRPGQI